MRQKHNMLLASVAALALLTGGGIAAAQQSPQGQNGSAAGVSSPGAAQTPSAKSNSGAEQHAQTSSPGGGATPQSAEGSKGDQPAMAQQKGEGGKSENRSAQSSQKSTGQAADRSAQSSQKQLGANAKTSGKAEQRLGENAKSKDQAQQRLGRTERTQHNRSSARNAQEQHNGKTAERNKRNGDLKGLQGNAAVPMQGSHVNLTSDQKTRIRDTVIDARGAPRVGHVDFDVTVGTVVPRERVHVVRVPETLVRIDSQWDGYLYFIVENEVVIVNPRDMRIVAVLEV